MYTYIFLKSAKVHLIFQRNFILTFSLQKVFYSSLEFIFFHLVDYLLIIRKG